ncbi:hypothetical protein [Streptomyces sp. NPDC047972]|uniref:hypothetical protein n=1 Tax=Streptomyces sp. NPDC047972 TaxID=3365493 RepID=UPI00371AD97D
MVAYVPFNAGENLNADKLNSRLVQEIMEWTPFTSIGSFSAGFSAATHTPMMRKIKLLGQERWEYKGRITVANGTIPANSNTTGFTFASTTSGGVFLYRPTYEHGWSLVGGSTGFYSLRCTLSTGGLLQFGLPTGAPSTTSGILLDGCYIDAPI